MPPRKFYGAEVGDFLELEVLLLGDDGRHLVVAAGTPTADWALFEHIYAANAHRDPRLLPYRFVRNGVTTYSLRHNLQSADLAPLLGRIMKCRCKVAISRHPKLLQSMMRLTLFQTPFI